MAIERGQGNLLTADVDALVNTVNTEGVMGKGLALQFKKAFPDSFASYERACRDGALKTGQVHIVQRLTSPHFIVNFPTKASWRQPSRIEYIRDGLADLIRQVKLLEIQSIAVPPLGCGNGGLQWSVVRPLIVEAFAAVPNVRVVLFEASDGPSPGHVIDRRTRPKMTPGRAAIFTLMSKYMETGYDYALSLLEVQKLAYLLQVAGEALSLEFKPHIYGPYADDLRKFLRNTEGHYTQGVGDGKNSPTVPLELLPGTVEEAATYLNSQADTWTRLQRVAELIQGFESPFGMELLTTVHWVMHHGADPDDLADVTAKVHAWNRRKHETMKPGHVRAAWVRLREHGWAGSRVDIHSGAQA